MELFIVSLLLHSLSFYFIFSLYQKQNKLHESQTESFKIRGELEELLAGYTKEIKHENDELKKMLSSSIDSEKKRNSESRSKLNTIRSMSAEDEESREEVTMYHPPEPKTGDKVEKSLQSEVLSLSANGYTVSEIAKELQVGKTEVELLLKFHQK